MTATPPFAWFLLMNSLSAMRRVIITTTPAPRPMRGHFCEFMNEKAADFWIGAGTSLLLIKGVVLRVTFASSDVSLKIAICGAPGGFPLSCWCAGRRSHR